jgi:hypothetical protein
MPFTVRLKTRTKLDIGNEIVAPEKHLTLWWRRDEFVVNVPIAVAALTVGVYSAGEISISSSRIV